ncbi:MAG: pyridoxal phosphate-dependent aminotransferase family protein [Candidatus Sumerlaeota bacterium]|nr:pyridoxal phosphate-dependent aminotransferase family protein [Candidatus Sumerlaeota bacterium]
MNAEQTPFFQTPEGPRMVIGDKTYDWFSGCGYLGYYGNPEILQAAADALLRYGLRSLHRPGLGVYPPRIALERAACRFFETPQVMIFSSGYLGAFLLSEAFDDRFDIAFMDAEAHYCIEDALNARRKPLIRFAHLDAEDLARLLKRHIFAGQRPLVMTDGMFPVTGAIPPLPDYWKALSEYDGALLCVDDAHAFGVIGAKGQGSLEYFGMQGDRRYCCGTLSKAFGSFGGIIPGDAELMRLINERSGANRGAASPPVAMAAAAARAIEITMERPEIRASLAGNVAMLRKGLHDLGLPVQADHPAPIIALDSRSGLDLKQTHERLLKEFGIYTMLHTRYRSAPPGGAIRIAVFATHTREQIERLIDSIKRIAE